MNNLSLLKIGSLVSLTITFYVMAWNKIVRQAITDTPMYLIVAHGNEDNILIHTVGVVSSILAYILIPGFVAFLTWLILCVFCKILWLPFKAFRRPGRQPRRTA